MQAHAYLLIAPSLSAADIAPELKRESVDTRHLITSSLGIDEARRLVLESNSRSLGEQGHSFVIVASGLTHEAQNALLKLFEEPPKDTVFYLIVPHESMLLPTLRSRLIKLEGGVATTTEDITESFLAMDIKEQIEEIATLAKNNPESLKGLILALGKRSDNRAGAKHSLLLATNYISNRGASRKMLAEEVVLSLQE